MLEGIHRSLFLDTAIGNFGNTNRKKLFPGDDPMLPSDAHVPMSIILPSTWTNPLTLHRRLMLARVILCIAESYSALPSSKEMNLSPAPEILLVPNNQAIFVDKRSPTFQAMGSEFIADVSFFLLGISAIPVYIQQG